MFYIFLIFWENFYLIDIDVFVGRFKKYKKIYKLENIRLNIKV